MGYRSTVFGRQPWINTIIGGVAGSISSKSALATKLGISESIIKRFEIVGSDVHAHISTPYIITGSAFTGSLTGLTSYLDLSGMVHGIGAQCFSSNTTLINAYFPVADLSSTNTYINATSFTNALYGGEYICNISAINNGGANFRNTRFKKFIAPNLTYINGTYNLFQLCSQLELFDAKKLKSIGTPPLYDGLTFSGVKSGIEINVHIDMLTINSGSPWAALSWAKTNRAAIVKFYDDNGNYVSTL